MVNTATSAITKEDMMKVIELSQHEPKVMDFSSLAPAPNAAAAGGKQGKGKGGGDAAAGGKQGKGKGG